MLQAVWASYQICKIAGCACARNAGNVSPPPRVSYPDMHQGTCVTHVPWCMPGLLTNGFVWSRWRRKRSRHSRRMHHPQFYVSGKRSMIMSTNRAIKVLCCQVAWNKSVCLSDITKSLNFNHRSHSQSWIINQERNQNSIPSVAGWKWNQPNLQVNRWKRNKLLCACNSSLFKHIMYWRIT